jgi:hypothetical protein
LGSGSNPYRVRLEDLGPPPEDRTTSVEYVADRLKHKPSPYTIEGMIDGIGQLSSAAVEDPESPRGRSARAMVLWLLVPFVVAGIFELAGVLRLL